MKLSIKNLGPIKKGEIPLNSNFLFFVGYNNSGKSYATQLIWAIYNEQFRNEFFNELNFNKITRVKKLENFVFNKEIASNLLKEFELYIENNIQSIYQLDKKEFKKFKIHFYLNDTEIEKLINTNNQTFTITKISGATKKVVVISRSAKKEKLVLEGDLEDIEFNLLKRKIIEFYFFTIFDSSQSFFLPAIRGAYVNLFQYINRYEKEKKDTIDKFLDDTSNVDIGKVISLIEESRSSYTMATNYLIEQLTKLSSESKDSNKYTEFVEMVASLIGGEIVKKNSELIGNSKFYLNIKNNTELPMHISSSTANQLAPLYLFFKYWGHEHLSDMLIIDEPEENLHPKNQIKFLEMMFEFISKDNNKVLITSHSPLLTKLLNSYIAYNELSDENKVLLADKIDFKPYDCINKDNVKICFFNGEEILPYPVTEYGVMFKDFLNVEDKVNEQFRIITNTVFEQNE